MASPVATLLNSPATRDSTNVDNITVTLSRTIGANKSCLAFFVAHSTAPADASTCSGGGLTWNKIATSQRGNVRITAFAATGVASPSGTSVTFTNVGATSPNGNDGWVYEMDSTDPSTWQADANNGQLTSAVTVALGAAPPTDSLGIACVCFLDNTGSTSWTGAALSNIDNGTHASPTCTTTVGSDSDSAPQSVEATYSVAGMNCVMAYVSIQGAGAPPTTTVTETFTRSSSSGWTGSMDTGQVWHNNDGSGSSGTHLTMDGSHGLISRSAVGNTENQLVSPLSVQDQTGYMEFQFDKLPVGAGTDMSISLIVRYVDQDNHLYGNLRIYPNGSADLTIGRELATVDSAISGTYSFAASFFAVSTWYAMKTEAIGINPTAVQAKVWALAGSEPGWQVTQNESNAVYQAALSMGLRFHVDASITNSPIVATFDNYTGQLTTGPGGISGILLLGGL